ncbi:hypothetical protein OG607_13595 [Streptomyces sp. NBC_01537]|uniref:hypothetical protein n=1 Tax=Streptomyces sp. NBC_01537 TaxID=2903896 RepID=UPI00386B35EF
MNEPQDKVPDDATVHLARVDRADTGAPVADAAPEYSATVLDDSWFRIPEEGPTRRAEPEAEPEPERTVVLPDRVEGAVLRFGPGVTATLPFPVPLGGPPGGGRRRAGLRRYALAAAVLVVVLAFLAWQRIGPDLAVREVTVATESGAPGCDGTARVVAAVRTNGAGGTIDYRWFRSDGTRSGLLHEKVPAGRKQTRLRLLWTFHGQGTYRARAELRIVSPAARTAGTWFTYICP